MGSDCEEELHIEPFIHGCKWNELRGKPKIFFIQACRGRASGDSVDYHANGSAIASARNEVQRFERDEVQHFNREHDEVQRPFERNREKPTDKAHFFFGYATVLGDVAYVRRGVGSPFIYGLCEELKKHAHRDSLQKIMQATIDIVQSLILSNNEEQVPIYSSTLTQDVFFF